MTIFVRNLNFKATASHLSSLFVRFGEVNSIKIMRDRDTGHSMGAALIEMDNRSAMIAIAELNDLNFMNYYLDVAEA